MTLQLSPIDGGYLVGDHYAISPIPISDKITFSLHPGSLMVYEKGRHHHIHFPGEYDLGICTVRVIEIGSQLQYCIKDASCTFAIVGHKEALRHAYFETHVDHRFVSSQPVADMITQLEYTGTIEMIAIAEIV